jgi:hypothetical protein
MNGATTQPLRDGLNHSLLLEPIPKRFKPISYPNTTPTLTLTLTLTMTLIVFLIYNEKVRPGLTDANREKQVAFAHHVFSNWNLPRTQKILWTMSDEKWWYGLILRTFAKMCPALGIEKEVFTCHHKKHIGKVTPLS